MASWSPSSTTTMMGRAAWLAALFFLAVPARAQEDTVRCDSTLAAAEGEYIRGGFDRAITLVSECLSTAHVVQDERVRAYRLLSLAYLRKEDLENARLAVLGLLSVDPGYEPDPIQDPPSYISLVDIVKQQLIPAPIAAEPMDDPAIMDVAQARPSWFRRYRKWIFAGGALVMAGTTGIILAGGEGAPGSSSLPLPPGLP